MRVQIVSNHKALEEMSRSKRRFVLDSERGLVVASTIRTQIAKEVLLELTPQPGCKDEDTRRDFAAWLGMRYTRAVHPDAYVEAIRRPLVAKLAELRKAGDHRMLGVDQCRLRVFPPDNENVPPPYEVELYFVMPDAAMEGTDLAARIRSDISEIAPMLRDTLDKTKVKYFEFWTNPLNEMTAQDFLDTDDIPSDE